MTRLLRFSTPIAACIWAMAQFPCPAHAAWPHDPTVAVQVAPTSFSEIFAHAVVPDGAGGAIIAWVDHRNGTDDIYAQHVTAAGTVAAGWPASGLAVCSAAGDQGSVTGLSDGAGGAFITWDDGRGGVNHAIYAMRVNGNGTLASGWPANGQLLLSDPHAQVGPVIIGDGAGSAIVVWDYFFSASDIDLYGARISATGVVVWAHSLVAPGGVQVNPAILPDGGGGFFLAYEDNFSGNYDIRAWRFAPNGAPVWGPTDVCALTGNQVSAACAPDGAGGLFVAWRDHRGADDDIYTSRLSSAGTTYPGWSPSGNAVCQAAGDQVDLHALSDGAGGVILSWTDHRSGGTAVYAQRVLQGGFPPPAWPANGIAVAPVPGSQFLTDALPDGAGGAFLVWQDNRLDFLGDMYMSRLTGSGAVAPGWSYAGNPLALAGSSQSQSYLAADGRGGVIAAWQDNRNPGPSQIFAGSIDRFGQLGDARPAIASVKDVKADQGGHVRLAWSASYLDASPALPISSYWVWRQTPAGAAAAAVSGGGGWLDAPGPAAKLATAPDEAAPGRRWFRHADDATADFAWEFVGSQPANGFAQYSFVAPTASDSVPGFNPYTVFMVEARGVAAGTFWDSPPDSSYSVDNLPPLAPAPVALTYSGGVAQLHWGRNLESDLANYRVYRGTSAAFVPGPSNLIGSPPDTGFADASAPVFYYKLSAVDAHGNESAFALLSPTGTTDAPDEPTALRLSRPVPNPASGPARIAFALPHESHVRLVVHDVAGRTVRVLVDGVLPAGEHEWTWDRRDATGAAAHAGLYFVRMEAEGRRFNERLVVTGE